MLQRPTNSRSRLQGNSNSSNGESIENHFERVYKECLQPTKPKMIAGIAVRDEMGNIETINLKDYELPGIRKMTEEEVNYLKNCPDIENALWTYRKTSNGQPMSAFEKARNLLRFMEFTYNMQERCEQKWGEHFTNAIGQVENSDDAWMEMMSIFFKEDVQIGRFTSIQSLNPYILRVSTMLSLATPTTKTDMGNWRDQDQRTAPPKPVQQPTLRQEAASVEPIPYLVDAILTSTDEPDLHADSITATQAITAAYAGKAITITEARNFFAEVKKNKAFRTRQLALQLVAGGTPHVKELEALAEAIENNDE